jgi:hypothetical protein
VVSKPKKGIRVRGTCRSGHTTEAVSTPGRSTWNGTCSDPGCELPVTAKRIPRRPRTPATAAHECERCTAMTLDHANGSVLDESSSPSSPPQPLLSPPTSLFGFGSLPGTEDGPDSPTEDDPGSDSETEWPSELLELDDSDPDESDPSSSPASSADKPAQLLSKAQMRKTARASVKIGTGMAHTVAAKTEAQRAVGLYLADDEDAANIGDPLADLMHRRGDVIGGKLSPDANDFLRSLMGVAGYLTKQIQKIGIVRQLEAPAQQAADVQSFPDVA